MLEAVHEKAARKQRRRTMFMGCGVTICALTVILLLAFAISAYRVKQIPKVTPAYQASLLTDSGALGYAVVGIVAFLLGVSVTVFCLLLQKRREQEEKRHD